MLFQAEYTRDVEENVHDAGDTTQSSGARIGGIHAIPPTVVRMPYLIASSSSSSSSSVVFGLSL